MCMAVRKGCSLILSSPATKSCITRSVYMYTRTVLYLLGLRPQESSVWPQVELLFGRGLPGDGVDDQEAVLVMMMMMIMFVDNDDDHLVGPQHGSVLLTAPIHVGAVHKYNNDDDNDYLYLYPHLSTKAVSLLSCCLVPWRKFCRN